MLVWLAFSSKGKGSTVVLVGLAESGKTCLWTKLVTGKYVQTLTSMTFNEGVVNTGKRVLPIVDVPGHERLRARLWSHNVERARAIIFVVDSLLFLSNIRDVADFLYTVLSDPIVNKRKLPVLVACNKQDEPKAKAAKVIANQLEKELNNIRATRSAALESTDGSDDGSVVIGHPGRDFAYGDLKLLLEFVNCTSADEKGLEQVWNWLRKL